MNDRGWFADPPMDKLLTEFATTYPNLWKGARAHAAVNDRAS